ncbi:fasciclin domain-containing protein [Octadecabacter sp. SW4]|uniref:fasciclin domain-containing protein n=1 Tax=Octadecabacter sp. SW4 TaxID=2602067 RepID=UPI0011C1FDB6|nr:fasciclin domain-containing protein [Octadecabacter sp. SW4]QEE36859.1 fasciclin domain-containing protein [Octadecabacter sp. SW4]|tara:strand:+ start:155 stop:631 length:477 start_codon:yes stop_codon:yes gene_type:complete
MLRRTFIAATAATALATAAFSEGHSMDIVDTAIGAGSFNTLVAAVQAAGLEETLRGDGPFTVFAPTDEAFAALPEGTVEGLLADPEALAAILTYHVVAGKVMSGDLSDNMMATTVNGDDIMVSMMGGVMVNDANVVSADIEASNGVIHVIDKVIMPGM